MLGTIWLAWRGAGSVRAGALRHRRADAVRVVAAVHAHHPGRQHAALSFRLQPTLTVLLSAAGFFGFIDIARAAAAQCGTGAS